MDEIKWYELLINNLSEQFRLHPDEASQLCALALLEIYDPQQAQEKICSLLKGARPEFYRAIIRFNGSWRCRMCELSLNDTVRRRVISEEAMRSVVYGLSEKYAISPDQREVLEEIGRRYESLWRELSSTEEKEEWRRKANKELDALSEMARREGEPFHEAFVLFLHEIEGIVSELSV